MSAQRTATRLLMGAFAIMLLLPVTALWAAPEIGVAKRVSSRADLGGGLLEVGIELVVENLGDIRLTNVQVIENLDTTFPAPVTYAVTAISVASATVTANGGFNGSDDTQLLVISTLEVGASATIQFTVRFSPNGEPGPFSNSVTASAESTAGTAPGDISDDGELPDPNGNGNPGDAGEDDPTQIVITLCEAGTFSGDGFVPECTPCDPGTAQPSSGSTTCPECAVDTFSESGATTCDSCPPPQIAAGDCTQEICNGGVWMSVIDDDDVLDDGVACTVDSCELGVPTNTGDDAECNDDDQCTMDTCLATGCANDPVADCTSNTPADAGLAGEDASSPDGMISDDGCSCRIGTGDQFPERSAGACLILLLLGWRLCRRTSSRK